MRWLVCLPRLSALLFIINDLSETNGCLSSEQASKPLQIMGSNRSAGARARLTGSAQVTQQGTRKAEVDWPGAHRAPIADQLI
jgi:hypothetical protein